MADNSGADAVFRSVTGSTAATRAPSEGAFAATRTTGARSIEGSQSRRGRTIGARSIRAAQTGSAWVEMRGPGWGASRAMPLTPS